MSNEESEEKETPTIIINNNHINPFFSDLHPLLRNDVVFPPSNHENLPLQKPTTIIPSSSPPPPSNHGTRDVALRWALRARSTLLLFLRRFRHFIINLTNDDINKRWFGCVAVGVTVLVWWLYARWRRRKDPTLLAITELDEKIKQLLHQIAQTNQLLLSLHKNSLSQGGEVT